MKFRVGHLSIIGKRDNNEDAYFIDDPFHRFFLVADGMGGQSAGEKASSLAMEIIPRKLRHLDFEKATAEQTIQTINDAVSEANIEIMAGGEVNSKLKNMGTTLVFVVRVVETLFVGGVGDSRVYLLRAGTLQQLTTDHSLTQALVDAGTLTLEEAANHRYRNVLYRYLGCKEGGQGPTPKTIKAEVNDKYLICSDGVTGGADDLKLAELLISGTCPDQTAKAIVQAATDGGSKDNITAVVLFVDQ